MELYNKGTFSEDILPVVIIGKSQHYILVVFRFMWLSGFSEYSSMSTHNSFLHAKYIQNISILVLLFLSPIFIFFFFYLYCSSVSNLKCCIAAKVQN